MTRILASHSAEEILLDTANGGTLLVEQMAAVNAQIDAWDLKQVSDLTDVDRARVRQLRSETNLGIMDVAKAYLEAEGDMEVARRLIKETESKGIQGI